MLRFVMTKDEALAIATEFSDREGHRTTIDEHTNARLYESFENVTGAAWVIEAALPPSTFEGSNTLTYVVSVAERSVKYFINSSGFNKYPDDPESEFDDDELEELRAAGFEILE
jgi:hypothetical protein